GHGMMVRGTHGGEDTPVRRVDPFDRQRALRNQPD
ncbi:MAG: hypothetical protein JWM01_457, partial [Arthrobacter sp.]|nr:hypothetical protein [Arthrobacter sp.]